MYDTTRLQRVQPSQNTLQTSILDNRGYSRTVVDIAGLGVDYRP